MADDVSQDVPELINRANQGLSAVRLLIDNGFPTEAVSRAYYAMFYAATALLHSEGITVSKHSAVIAQIGQRFAKPGRISPDLHRALIDMFDERQLADYGGVSFGKVRAEAAFEAARAFVRAAEEYLTEVGLL